jgi:aconitate decarboxylase
MGIECGVLASMGWTANADLFGAGGFFDSFMAGVAVPHLLIEGFGDPFRMVDPGVGFKKYPSNYFTHRPIDAALALRAEHGIDPMQIESVEVLFPPFDYVNRPQPATGLDGKFSVQYTTAIALLDGEVTIDSFANERRFADDAEALLRRVTLVVDPTIPRDFDATHTVVTAMLRDGRKLTKRVKELSGWVGFPLTREQRLAKFHGCARRVITPERANRVVTLIESLETLPDTREILDLVRDSSPMP